MCLEEKECYLFEEEDGIEIEDDFCFLEYDKGIFFVFGSKWILSLVVLVSKSIEVF